MMRMCTPWALALGLLAAAAGCHRPTEPPGANEPPHTRLANVPKENDTVFALATLYWDAGVREAVPNADDLRARLEACVAEARAASATPIELKIVDTSALGLPRVAQAQAYHIVREALLNARRHAGARHVVVTVSRRNGTACFVVEDDGHGFEREGVDEQQHLGLSIMRTRAERCGGTLHVESELGQGTRVTTLLPALD